MSIFEETVWETDETGDKLTKELFVKGRKKKDKPRIKSGNVERISDNKLKDNSGKKSETNARSKDNFNVAGAPATGDKVNVKKRKHSEITIDETIIKKWKFESGGKSGKRTSAGAPIVAIDEPVENKSNSESKEKLNKLKGDKKLSVADSETPIKRSKLKKNMTEADVAKKAEKQRLKRKKEKLRNQRIGARKGTPLDTTEKQIYSERANDSRLKIDRLKQLLLEKKEGDSKNGKDVTAEPKSLRDRMLARLKSSRFRFLNEQLYNSESWSSKKYFNEDPDAFLAYHEGYQLQVEQWPVNPLDVIISSIKKMPKDYVVADFGCGEARLASSVSQKVHSLDLVAINDTVTACDMAHTPLLTGRIDVVVFCLSLMGTNLTDYLTEANRVLRKDGILKLAEVESRFEDVDEFVKTLSSYGFVNTWKDLSHNLFYFMDFKKSGDITKKRNKLPSVTLKSCSYKKR